MSNKFIQNILDKHFVRFTKFAVVGGSGTLVNLGLQYILKEFAGLDYKIASRK